MSVSVQLPKMNSVIVSTIVGCYGLACPSLRGMSEVPHSISDRIQSVSKWFVLDASRARLFHGMDALLLLRIAAEIEPLELGRTLPL